MLFSFLFNNFLAVSEGFVYDFVMFFGFQGTGNCYMDKLSHRTVLTCYKINLTLEGACCMNLNRLQQVQLYFWHSKLKSEILKSLIVVQMIMDF